MRRKNPPQAYIDKSDRVERYLRSTTLALVYGITGIAYAVIVSLVFADLLYESILKPTTITVTIFAVVGFIPTILIFLAYFLRPDDPLSSYLTRLMNLWRTPFDVPPDQCTFKVRLMNGEALCIDLTFYYPLRSQTPPVKERLYTYVQGAIAKACSARDTIPARQEIEEEVDPALEVVAREYNIPVLYMKIQNIYNAREDEPALLVEYSSARTWELDPLETPETH